jgi:hypothetical protein
MIPILLACACGTPGDGHTGDSAEVTDPCAPAVEIGTGEDIFVDLADGAPLMMVHGPQGGWHMLASVRVTGTLPEVHIQYEIEHEPSGVTVSNNSYNLALLMEEGCSGTYVGMYGYLGVGVLEEGEFNTPPELLDGDTLILRMDVQDIDFVKALGELRVIAVRDPADDG